MQQSQQGVGQQKEAHPVPTWLIFPSLPPSSFAAFSPTALYPGTDHSGVGLDDL